MELFSKEVDTEVTMLTCCTGSRDANDLAWTTLEDEEITHADVMAWNRDSRRSHCGLVLGWVGSAMSSMLTALYVQLSP